MERTKKTEAARFLRALVRAGLDRSVSSAMPFLSSTSSTLLHRLPTSIPDLRPRLRRPLRWTLAVLFVGLSPSSSLDSRRSLRWTFAVLKGFTFIDVLYMECLFVGPPTSSSDPVYNVMKQVHPDTGISFKAMSVMNSFVNDV